MTKQEKLVQISNKYLRAVADVTRKGDAREESYYRVLAVFLEESSEALRRKKAHVTILPKKTDAGNPDMRVTESRHSQIGYTEVKPLGTNLDKIEKSDQLKRYRGTFPNLILTNLYEFRMYRGGDIVDTVHLAKPFLSARMRSIPPAENLDGLAQLLERFFSFSLPPTVTAEELAKELAIRTRFLRDEVIKEEFRETRGEGGDSILGFYEAFKKHLIANLKPDEFADLYAQTITYGLFAARTRANGVFTRKLAYELIPKSIGILRDIFRFISFDEPPPSLAASVDDIAEVLAAADVKEILRQYFRDGKGSDPIFHFYETFLAEYNPEEREQRGVYYTPEPVVSFIVRSLNLILKDKFEKKDGFATQSVTVLDPASGTLTFLAEAMRLAVEEYTAKYGNGSKAKFIEDHILQDFYAFELMMAPYAAGHLKMGYLLEELGHRLSGNERFKSYLTNTLEMENVEQTNIPILSSLSEESRLAGQVKKSTPILVVLGNPPYSGESANASEREIKVEKGNRYITSYTIVTELQNGRTVSKMVPNESKANRSFISKQKTWIGRLIEDYKIVDGRPLGERNSKWLQDDYVKFIRFAQSKIDTLGEGVLGFVTNHSYLDNPTFRGMRQSLMNSFDEIYILDLHGHSKRKEKAPDGSEDKNVFDIRQGVAIGLFVKTRRREVPPVIYHSDLWGSQHEKYNWLLNHDISSVSWRKLEPKSPQYLFVPANNTLTDQYNRFPSIQKIFPVNSVGIVTARDHLTIAMSPREMWERVVDFASLSATDARTKYELGHDVRDWKVALAKADIEKSGPSKGKVIPILYRPFDLRHTYYTGQTKGFHCMPRRDVMQHMLKPNVCIVCPKRVETKMDWGHAFLADQVVDHVAVSLKTIDYCFPLYLYPEVDKHDLFSSSTSQSRKPNIATQIMATLDLVSSGKNGAMKVFSYCYAILQSNVYRRRYAEFLCAGLPRIPFTRDLELFQVLSEIGTQLVDLHLLKSSRLSFSVAKCSGSGDLNVDKVVYDVNHDRVYINSKKWFEAVSNSVWSYHIGGYQVAEKWLKDRKGRELSSEDVSTYCKIVTAIAHTIEVQAKLDPLYAKVEETLLDIKL